MVIDVNVKKGQKKKIYVYQGDNAKDLAAKFAIKNSSYVIRFGRKDKREIGGVNKRKYCQTFDNHKRRGQV